MTLSLTPAERTQRAGIAAHSKWAVTSDPTAATAPARRAFDERFLAEVDPHGVLSLAERARRAESAKRAYFSRLALRSAISRRKSKELAAQADAADAELQQATA